MDPIVKQFINGLKCPLCQGQIDIIDWKIRYSVRKHNFCCVNNWEHYRLFLNQSNIIINEYETIVIYDQKKKYEIIQDNVPDDNYTTINIYQVDAENRVLEKEKNYSFTFKKSLFNFAQTNREKILNRIKTVMVFW